MLGYGLGLDPSAGGAFFVCLTAALTLTFVVGSPNQALSPRTLRYALWTQAALNLTFLAGSTGLLAVGWTLSAGVVAVHAQGSARPALRNLAVLSSLPLVVALAWFGNQPVGGLEGVTVPTVAMVLLAFAVAVRMGVDRAYISGLELGHRNPTVITLWRAAVALGIRPVQLVDETGLGELGDDENRTEAD